MIRKTDEKAKWINLDYWEVEEEKEWQLITNVVKQEDAQIQQPVHNKPNDH